MSHTTEYQAPLIGRQERGFRFSSLKWVVYIRPNHTSLHKKTSIQPYSDEHDTDSPCPHGKYVFVWDTDIKQAITKLVFKLFTHISAAKRYRMLGKHIVKEQDLVCKGRKDDDVKIITKLLIIL